MAVSMSVLRPYLLLISAISFGLGISLPLVRFEKLWLLSETPSLIGIVAGLWQDGNGGLALVVALFSLLFPVLKMAVAFRAAIADDQLPQWASILSKWSMMDVLLVAIVIFAAKTSGLATAISQPGIWLYGLSAVTLALASFGGAQRATGRMTREPENQEGFSAETEKPDKVR